MAQEAAENRRAIESENARLRTWRMQHWSEQARLFRAEAHASRDRTLKRLEDDYNDKVEQIYDEWGARETAKTRMQVEGAAKGRDFDDHGLQLFGAYADDVPVGHDKVSIGHVSDGDLIDYQITAAHESLDSLAGIRDVHLFSSQPDTSYEQQQQQMMEDSSELM